MVFCKAIDKPVSAMLLIVDSSRPTREADADFLSVYHLIGPRNQPETPHCSINALFELNVEM